MAATTALLERTERYLTFEKVLYKSGWHFKGVREQRNQINISRPKPEVELRLTFSSILAISSA